MNVTDLNIAGLNLETSEWALEFCQILPSGFGCAALLDRLAVTEDGGETWSIDSSWPTRADPKALAVAAGAIHTAWATRRGIEYASRDALNGRCIGPSFVN